jgi:hypothetical protein
MLLITLLHYDVHPEDQRIFLLLDQPFYWISELNDSCGTEGHVPRTVGKLTTMKTKGVVDTRGKLERVFPNTS